MRKARSREVEVGSCKIQGKQQHSLELSSSSSASSLVLEALILLQPFDRHIQYLHMCGLYIYMQVGLSVGTQRGSFFFRLKKKMGEPSPGEERDDRGEDVHDT